MSASYLDFYRESAPADYAPPLKRLDQAWCALTAIANGLDELDAQLLYGFTGEELAAHRLTMPASSLAGQP